MSNPKPLSNKLIQELQSGIDKVKADKLKEEAKHKRRGNLKLASVNGVIVK